jgi:hypothetical protein
MRKKTVVVSSRIPKTQIQQLQALADQHRLPVGSYLRILLREHLAGKTLIKWWS